MLPQQDNPHNLWLPKIEDWGKIDEKAYQVIFDQAKERFLELKENSEDLTERGQKLLIGISTFIAAFFGTSISVKASAGIIVVAILLFAIDLYLIVTLLVAKNVATKGSRPSESFPAELDNEKKYKPDEQFKLVLYKQVILYEAKIDQMKSLNNDRTWKYQVALIYSLLLIIGTIIYVIYSIYLHRP